MRMRLFVPLFCVFVLSGQVLAQNHKWVEIRTPLDYYGSSSIDTNNIKRLPNGNVTYFLKTPGNTVYQHEVDCQAKRRRTLSETNLDYRDAYGNLVRATPSRDSYSYPGAWGSIGDGSPAYFYSTEACQSASRATEPVVKPTPVRKVVKRKLKRGS